MSFDILLPRMDSAKPRRVLIVDDSAVARALLARRFRAHGLVVIEEDSVASAAFVDPTVLACALLDLELGDGDGTQIALALRACDADLPIAFFSSADEGKLRARAADIGPVFTKPDDLGAAVQWATEHAERFAR